MVVDELQFLAAQQIHNTASDPFPSRICVLAREIHESPVVLTYRRLEIEECLALFRPHSPFLICCKGEKSRGNRVAESA